jgi:N-formylglutamate amidohydrolase
MDDLCRIESGDGPIIGVAVHAGHAVRPEIQRLFAIGEAERLREEDPYTEVFAQVAHTKVIGTRSRFELDLNRTRQDCVYRDPGGAWGLDLWKEPLPRDVLEQSWALHDAFYNELHELLLAAEARHGGFVVLDIHSYNHQREGAPADQATHPDVNIGTGTVDHELWGPLVTRFLDDLRGPEGLDARENVKFKGRFLAAWVHATFPWTGCCLAVEFKKTFMDERTGEVFPDKLTALRKALARTVPGLEQKLSRAVEDRE